MNGSVATSPIIEDAVEIRALVLYEARDSIYSQTGVAACVWCGFLCDARARVLLPQAPTIAASLLVGWPPVV